MLADIADPQPLATVVVGKPGFIDLSMKGAAVNGLWAVILWRNGDYTFCQRSLGSFWWNPILRKGH